MGVCVGVPVTAKYLYALAPQSQYLMVWSGKPGCMYSQPLLFVVVGGIIYYIVVGLVLWMKMPSNDLKLFTAIIVAIFLAVPYLREKSRNSYAKAAKKGAK